MVDDSNNKDLGKWLQDQPREVSIVIAARAALRILPFFNEFQTITDKQINDIILPAFRAMALPWSAAKYPDHHKKLQATTSNAALASPDTLQHRTPTRAAAIATVNAFDTLDALDATLAAHAALDATHNAILATRTSIRSTRVAIAATRRADIRLIESNKSPQEIAQKDLWHGDPPVEITIHWQSLKTKLLARHENWQVWTDWYEARLYGKPKPIEALEISRATIDEEIWKQGPAVVNAHINWLIKKYTPQDTDDVLKQRPAPYLYFTDKDGRIDAKPMPGTPLSPDMTEDLRQELNKKAQKLKERLVNTQTPKKIFDTIDQLIESLGHKLDDVKPGILLSKSYSLEADINAYDTEQGRQELAEDVLASMLDVNATLTALKGGYPEIAEIEAAAWAQKLTGDMAGEVLQQTEKIIEAARISTDAITKKALEGLESELTDIHEAQQAIETEVDENKIASARKELEKRTSYHLLNVHNFINATVNEAKRVVQIIKKEAKSISQKVIKEAKNTSSQYWNNFDEHKDRARVAATLAGLACLLVGPVTGISVLGISAWRLLPKELEKINNAQNKKKGNEDEVDPDNNDDQKKT